MYSEHWTLYINLFAGNVIVAEEKKKANTEEENQTQEKECVKCFKVYTVYSLWWTVHAKLSSPIFHHWLHQNWE